MCPCVSVCRRVVRCVWSRTGQSRTVVAVCPAWLLFRPSSRWPCWWECPCGPCGSASSVSVSSGSAALQPCTKSVPGCSSLLVSQLSWFYWFLWCFLCVQHQDVTLLGGFVARVLQRLMGIVVKYMWFVSVRTEQPGHMGDRRNSVCQHSNQYMSLCLSVTQGSVWH